MTKSENEYGERCGAWVHVGRPSIYQIKSKFMQYAKLIFELENEINERKPEFQLELVKIYRADS